MTQEQALHRGSTTREGFAVLGVAIRREPRIFALSTLGSLLFGALTVADAWVLGWSTDHVVLPAFRDGHIDSSLLLAVLGLFLGVAILRAVGIVARRLGAGVMQYRMQAHYRRAVTRQYLTLPMEWHQRHPTGQLLSNANSDVEAAWGPIAPLPMAVGTVAMMVIAVVQMFFADIVLAVVGLLVFPAVIAANLAYQRRASPLMTRAQQLRAEVSEIAHESFDGAMVVKTLGREGEETDRFATKADELRDVNIRAGRIRAAFDPALAALPNSACWSCWPSASTACSTAAPTPATWSPSPTCSRSCPSRSARSAGCWASSRAASSASVASRRCSTPPARWSTATSRGRRPAPGPGSRSSTSPTPTTRPALLDDVELRGGARSHRRPGRRHRLRQEHADHAADPAGRPRRRPVRIDGTDLRDLARGELAGAVSIVPQTAFLFDDTVRGNITLGADVADDEVWAALRAAQADGFVAALPDGLDTRLGERGTSLSGGQRQRISLARALVRRPRLLILDDATSAVDPEVEARILAALRVSTDGSGPAPGPRSSSWPTARPPSALADEVVHLDEGRIVDRGTHAELLGRSPAYAHLVNAYEQHAADELAGDAS